MKTTNTTKTAKTNKTKTTNTTQKTKDKMKTTNTKNQVSKATAKKLEAIRNLEAKAKSERLTMYELKRLINAKMHIENKSLSKIHRELQKPSKELKPLISEMLGKNKFPTFNEFKEKAKNKGQYFSTWKGLTILCEFNKSAKLGSKLERQNKAIAKK